ncbi:phosphotransferase [Streptomyces sp. CC208A]|uniref:phosphotransferase n=1 Tax=Streptomyces sp. CC208A TaxID=3044573 RepID=UPI0024A9D6F5|nr:phosphotransferase [Streptomyces sp. CC208A]
MTGRLVGRGRSADVYEVGGDDGGWVLRRYRDGGDAEREARLMARLAGAGYPVPAVREAAGPDLVLERLTGPSLLDALLAGAYEPEPAGALLANLLHRLHTLPGGVVHLDLHPGNVMLTEDRGPVVIDWRTAEEGADPGLDRAMSALLLAEVAVSEEPYAPGARGGLAALLAAAPGPLLLAEARTRRAADPNLTAGEVAALGRAEGLVRNLVG